MTRHDSPLPFPDRRSRHRTSRRLADRVPARRAGAVRLPAGPGRARSAADARIRNRRGPSRHDRRSARSPVRRHPARGRSRRSVLGLRQPVPPQGRAHRARARHQRAGAAQEPARAGRLRGQVGRARAADRAGHQPDRTAQRLRILPRSRRPTCSRPRPARCGARRPARWSTTAP